MRGRKGKYYSQVDDEDQNFLEQERRLGNDDDEDERNLGMIEEESQHSTQRHDDDVKLLQQKPSPRELQLLENQILKEQTTSPRLQKVVDESKAIPEDEAEHLLEEDDKPNKDDGLRVSKNNV